MAVNKPTGDNARKGAVKKAHPVEEPAHEDINQAQQEGRAVYGSQEEREEVQGRQAGEILGKAAIAMVAMASRSVLGFRLG